MDRLVPPSTTERTTPVLLAQLMSITKATRQLMGRKLESTGVLAGQDHLLLILHNRERRTIVEIAASLSVRPATVSKMLDVFEKKGWAVREHDAQDKRKVFARLTPLGAHVQGRVREVWANLEAELVAHLEGDSAHTVIASLRQVDDVLTRRLARLR